MRTKRNAGLKIYNWNETRKPNENISIGGCQNVIDDQLSRFHNVDRG